MKLKRREHKGENGKVLVIGGSKDYIGAPAFAALAALRTGADIACVCAPEKVAWAINNYTPDLITKKFLGEEFNLTHAKELIALSDKYDVVVLGNGLGLNKEFVLKLLREIKKPFVIDADAIRVIPLDAVQSSIITPHMNEFESLYSNTLRKGLVNKNNVDEAIKAIMPYIGSNVILLKGQVDNIYSKSKKSQNKTGNNSMTKGGTGDILAGICAGYVSQGADLFEAATHSAYINGKLGEYMFKWKGFGYTSYDMLQELWRFTR